MSTHNICVMNKKKYPYFFVEEILSGAMVCIKKTYLYNFDPLKPHFCIVKLGFTGKYIIFLISAQKHTLWVLIRTVSVRGSNEYPQSTCMF